VVGPKYQAFHRRLSHYTHHSRDFCSSADSSNTSDENAKQQHSRSLSALLWIAHALPLACESEKVLNQISPLASWISYKDFHERCKLDGWNDHIIQPARDAVLEYYKVSVANHVYTLLNIHPQRYAKPSAVEQYMRLHNLS